MTSPLVNPLIFSLKWKFQFVANKILSRWWNFRNVLDDVSRDCVSLAPIGLVRTRPTSTLRWSSLTPSTRLSEGTPRSTGSQSLSKSTENSVDSPMLRNHPEVLARAESLPRRRVALVVLLGSARTLSSFAESAKHIFETDQLYLYLVLYHRFRDPPFKYKSFYELVIFVCKNKVICLGLRVMCMQFQPCIPRVRGPKLAASYMTPNS